ncbi:hypothetical protein L2E82_44617 [Cichorium intybus]|uniref:Uncharacterized protein n=1 Tax=Cichorium intybus TaxID=13427 RepID=A0ACB8ZRL8_CICIN|nr:hypothetical protein L2E82_44617 [Cichorium intybus]
MTTSLNLPVLKKCGEESLQSLHLFETRSLSVKSSMGMDLMVSLDIREDGSNKVLYTQSIDYNEFSIFGKKHIGEQEGLLAMI